MPDRPVTVCFRLTGEEFADGLRVITRRQPASWLTPLVGAAMLTVGALTGSAAALVWGLVLLALVTASARLLPRLRWHRSPHLAGEQRHTFAEDGITVEAAGRRGTLTWDFYREAVETPRAFVLMRTRKQGNFIPRRAFASPGDEERFRRLLADKGLLPG